jgi:alkylation response protein AidB-like acyl-CoA dehydrogenase
MTEAPPVTDADDLEAVKRGVRKLMTRYGPEYWTELDKKRKFPTAFFDEIAEGGYFAALIPRAFGGENAGPRVASAIVEEINRGGGDAAAINAQLLIAGTLVRDGTEEQKHAYLPKIATGELRCLTVAATEPDSGADMTALESTATRSDAGWVLEAKKVFISMAEHSDLMFLLVHTEEGPTLFLLEPRKLGDKLEIRPLELITNRMTTMLFIDELEVPDAARVGPVGEGLRCLMKGFALRRTMAAAECVGNARFMLDRSIEHAKTRVVRGHAIGEHQGVQYPLAQAYARVEAADLMKEAALDAIEQDAPEQRKKSIMAKILASEAAWDTARAALTAFGGWGLASEYHMERKLRESTVYVFNNLLLNFLSRELDLPAGKK